MIVGFLDAWGVQHQGGIVEDFEWVSKLEVGKVKDSVAKVGEKAEPVAPLVYFAYLELPVTEQVLDVEALLKGVAEGSQPASKE